MPGPSDIKTMDVQQLSESQVAAGATHHESSSRSGQKEAFWSATCFENSQKAVKDTTCPFMKTPRELRNQIYQYLLSTKYTKVDFTDEEPEFIAGSSSPLSRARRVYQFHPAILAVNRQINLEAGRILHENSFVKLTTIAPKPGLDLLNGGLRVVAERDQASRVTYAASEITFSTALMFDKRQSVYLFPVDEMTTFCTALMRYMWILCDFGTNFVESTLSGDSLSVSMSGSSLSVSITGVATTTTSILNLLEPLRRLHSLESVKIVGHVSNEYKSTFIDKMLKSPDVDAVVQEIQETVKEGDRATISKDYSIAVAKYKRAVIDVTNYSCWLSFENSTIDTRAKHSRETYNTIFYDNMLDLHTKLAVVHVKLQKYLRAQQWISYSLKRIYADNQISVENANIYSIAAQASEGLGMVERAVWEMREAVRRHPQDSLATELLRLEGKMQAGDGDCGCRKVDCLRLV